MAMRTRILYVDDHSPALAHRVDALERVGPFSIDTVDNASIAFDRLKSEQYDCVLSDLKMPGMDGIEFLSEVRERYPDLPFIVFSSQSDDETIAEVLGMGATDFLPKSLGEVSYRLIARRITQAVDEPSEPRTESTADDEAFDAAESIRTALAGLPKQTEGQYRERATQRSDLAPQLLPETQDKTGTSPRNSSETLQKIQQRVDEKTNNTRIITAADEKSSEKQQSEARAYVDITSILPSESRVTPAEESTVHWHRSEDSDQITAGQETTERTPDHSADNHEYESFVQNLRRFLTEQDVDDNPLREQDKQRETQPEESSDDPEESETPPRRDRRTAADRFNFTTDSTTQPAESGGTLDESISLEPGENVLFLRDADYSDRRAACWHQLCTEEREQQSLLLIRFQPMNTDQLTKLVDTAIHVHLICIGDTDWVPELGERLAVTAVEKPEDLRRLGIVATRIVKDWHADGEAIRICIDSLTVWLRYIDVQQLFRFLHLLLGKFASADAITHCHLDQRAEAERDVSIIKTLFDHIVEVRDSEVAVRES